MRALLVLLLLAVVSACAGPQSCALVRLADLPLEVHHNLIFITGWIGEQPVHLVVDTGAMRTTLTTAAAKRLGLSHDTSHIVRSVGIGGMSTNFDVFIPNIVLGHTRFPVPSLAVADFSLDHAGGPRVDGLLGADILLAFDMDIDIPGRHLTLYRVRRCADATPPWPQPAIPIAGIQPWRDRLLVPFTLDGSAGMAVLDTGAQTTTISMHMAERLGLGAASFDADRQVTVQGVAPRPATVHVHRFGTLRIGEAHFNAPVLEVVATTAGVGDGLIGGDFLQGRRVWLSFATRRLFVTAPATAAVTARP